MKASLSLAALSAATAFADDVLYSSRLSKRFIDNEGHYNMSFFHINDVHAHLDQFAASGTDCTDPSKGCYGGYARVKAKVDELRRAAPDNLWLNAGDEFQGTLFYSYYGGEKIAVTLNELEFDIMTLGNHEWDGGDDKLGLFLKNLTFPIVSCNVKSGVESLNTTIKNWHIFEEHGLAVIGATTENTAFTSNVGNLTTFLDPIAEIQKAIYEIRNTTDIRRIVALTHIGYDVDQKLASETEGLSLIIGGHSHTLVGDMKGASGPYPTIVKDLSGHEVFVVTAYRWGEYLGSIDLTFDEDGKALAYHGAPIHMDNTTAIDKDLQAQITAWREPFEKFSLEVVGSTKNDLGQSTCKLQDCLLGEVMAEAMLEYRRNGTKSDPSKTPDFALLNGGGVRAAVPAGNITRGEIITAFPFGNAIVDLKYSGADLRKVLEGCASKVSQTSQKPLLSWCQVSSGITVEYNPANAAGSQVVNVTIGGKPLDDTRSYNVVSVDFVARGGDNIVPATSDFVNLDTLDEVLVEYVQHNSPLESALEQRFIKVDKQAGSGSNGTKSGNGGDGTSAAGPLDVRAWRAFAAALGASVAF